GGAIDEGAVALVGGAALAAAALRGVRGVSVTVIAGAISLISLAWGTGERGSVACARCGRPFFHVATTSSARARTTAVKTARRRKRLKRADGVSTVSTSRGRPSRACVSMRAA